MNYKLPLPTTLCRQPYAVCRQTIASRHQPSGKTACVTQISDISFLVNRVQGAAVADSGVTG